MGKRYHRIPNKRGIAPAFEIEYRLRRRLLCDAQPAGQGPDGQWPAHQMLEDHPVSEQASVEITVLLDDAASQVGPDLTQGVLHLSGCREAFIFE